MPRPGSPLRVRRLALGLSGLALAVLVAAGWIAVRSFQREAAAHRPVRRPVPIADAAPLLNPSTVTIETPSGIVRGWYGSSANGAAVVVIHGSLSDRRSVVPEAAILAEAGYGVLLVDLPGHGESDGDVDWGGGARAAVVASIEELVRNQGIEPGRVGLLGSSMGGFTAIQVAAQDERVAAVIAIGAPHDQEEVTRWQNRRWGVLSEWPALWAMERAGLARDERRPVEEIGEISPRGVLIVAGSDDQVVPLGFARTLAEAGGAGSDLLVVDGAGHGGHVNAGGEAFRAAVIAFYDRHLGGHERASRP